MFSPAKVDKKAKSKNKNTCLLTKNWQDNSDIRLLKVFMTLTNEVVIPTQSLFKKFALEIKILALLILVIIFLPAATIRGAEVKVIQEFTFINAEDYSADLQPTVAIHKFQLADVEIQGRNTTSLSVSKDSVKLSTAKDKLEENGAMVVAELMNEDQDGFDPRLPFGYRVAREIYTEVSGYNPVPEQTDSTPCITASGKNICEEPVNVIAANWLKFGTKVRIPEYFGDTVFTVEDRMNTRYPHNIDVLFYNKTEARALGRRTLLIQVLEEVDTQVAQK